MSAPASRANTLAWILSAVVIAAGIVAWLATGRPLFLVFTALGVLTVVNVIVYDRMVLRRKTTQPTTEPPTDAPSQSTTLPEQGETTS